MENNSKTIKMARARVTRVNYDKEQIDLRVNVFICMYKCVYKCGIKVIFFRTTSIDEIKTSSTSKPFHFQLIINVKYTFKCVWHLFELWTQNGIYYDAKIFFRSTVFCCIVIWQKKENAVFLLIYTYTIYLYIVFFSQLLNGSSFVMYTHTLQMINTLVDFASVVNLIMLWVYFSYFYIEICWLFAIQFLSPVDLRFYDWINKIGKNFAKLIECDRCMWHTNKVLLSSHLVSFSSSLFLSLSILFIFFDANML